jgi:hypothetical protein
MADIWKYAFLDDVNKNLIYNAFQYVPSVIADFVEVSFMAVLSDWHDEYHNMWYPVFPYNICIIDGFERDAVYGGLTWGGGTGTPRISIAVQPLDPIYGSYRMGLRIWHELLHAYGLPADTMINNPAFDQWIQENYSPTVYEPFLADKYYYRSEPYYQEIFYTFLTEVGWGEEEPICENGNWHCIEGTNTKEVCINNTWVQYPNSTDCMTCVDGDWHCGHYHTKVICENNQWVEYPKSQDCGYVEPGQPLSVMNYLPWIILGTGVLAVVMKKRATRRNESEVIYI